MLKGQSGASLAKLGMCRQSLLTLLTLDMFSLTAHSVSNILLPRVGPRGCK